MKTAKMVVILVLAWVLSAEVANADFTFGEPTNLGPPVNSSSNDAGPSLSADGMTLFFVSNRPSGEGANDLWMTRRPTTSDPWTEPVNLGKTVNSPAYDQGPNISADGLSLFFTSNRSGGYGFHDLWVSIRSTTDDPWDAPVNLGSAVNTSAYETQSSLSAEGLTLFFSSDRHGGYGSRDLWMTTRPSRDGSWGAPANLGAALNTPAYENAPSISADDLFLIFWSDQAGGYGSRDLWFTTRPTKSDPWYPAVNVGAAINTPASESAPHISADSRTLHFWSDRAGGFGDNDIYQASIIPIVDFNGDGIVDAADMCIMVDHWGENYSLCDIGPMPWGDGIVDVEDLKVLAEHLFTYPGAVGYWKLDETEGNIASDSANDNDGNVYGDPAWQPEGGMVDGALQLDGIGDYVSTPFVLNPADGKFSVFVWIKGGAPGQAVLSQAGGANWLCADTLEGNLMTELKAYGRGATGPLLSQTVITDGNWHRIGLVWDGSERTLYVDDIAVAQDAQPDLEASENGLYIGAGKAMEPGSFWSGLIDDVRIYKRAVTP